MKPISFHLPALRRAMKRRGLKTAESLYDACSAVGWDGKIWTIQKTLQGSVAEPRFTLVVAMCRALRIRTEDLCRWPRGR
jgi:hypothetical protein